METFFGICILIYFVFSLLGGDKKKSNKTYNRTRNYPPKTNKPQSNNITKDLILGDANKRVENYNPTKKTAERHQKKNKTEIKRSVIKAENKKNSYIEVSFKRFKVPCLWHMTHRSNLDGILQRGILSHTESHLAGINNIDISDPEVQRWRDRNDNKYRRKVHDFTPLYINPKNPMLYVRKNIQNELCILQVSLESLEGKQFLITDGNAASRDTQFFDSLDGLSNLPWQVLHANYWNDFQDGRRKRCAEILVYPKVEPRHIKCIHCYSKETLMLVSNKGIPTKLNPNCFF